MFLFHTLVLLLLLSSQIVRAASLDDGHLDPWADTTPGVVPPAICRDIIKAAEQHGYPLEADSIDKGEAKNSLSQQIDIVEYGEVQDGVDELWKLIEPILSRVTEIVQATKEKVWGLEKARQKASTAEWIFLRKYAPSTERNMLKLHKDSNMFTVNLFLNDDYDGGGLFYVRPPIGLGYQEYAPSIPSIPVEWQNYDWLANVKRENTTALRFPDLKQGDLLIHNYTVWHAVAPLEHGVKYSLLFFFDMDNPEIQSMINKRVSATFINHVTEGTVDLIWMDDNSATIEEDVLEEAMVVGEENNLICQEGHQMRAVRREDGMILAEFEIESGRTEPYEIFEPESTSEDLDVVYINRVETGIIDLFWVHPHTGELSLLEDAMPAGVAVNFQSIEGHVIRAIRREDLKVLAEFTTEAQRTQPYEIFDSDMDAFVLPSSSSEDGHLDPWADTFPGAVSKETCKAIIAAAEEHGYPLEPDSIDAGELNNAISQQIDIVEFGELKDGVDELWTLIEPLVPIMTDIAQNTKENVWHLEYARKKRPTADWIFLRKYAPSTERNMLKLHHDINMFTVNVFLNDDYEGGGLFYVRPPINLGFNPDAPTVPLVPEQWLPYDWLGNVKRENTTITRFPELHSGDVLIHNYTVWHGVAPLEAGFKYSLIFFFDMDNPHVQGLKAKEVGVTFINHVSVGTIDLVKVDAYHPEEVLVEKGLPVGKEMNFNVWDNSIVRAVRREDDLVVEFTIEDGRTEPYHILETDFDTRKLPVVFINRVETGTIDLFWVHPLNGSLVLFDDGMEVGTSNSMRSQDGHVFRAIRREDGKMIDEFVIDTSIQSTPYEIVEILSNAPSGSDEL